MEDWIFLEEQKVLNDGWVLTTVVTCQWQKNQFWFLFESQNEMIKIDFGMKKSGNIWTREANEGNMLLISDDVEMFTSEVHDPYARTTSAWK